MVCEHNWKALYYRKSNKNKSFQVWIKVLNKLICDKCEKIADIKEINGTQ